MPLVSVDTLEDASIDRSSHVNPATIVATVRATTRAVRSVRKRLFMRFLSGGGFDGGLAAGDLVHLNPVVACERKHS